MAVVGVAEKPGRPAFVSGKLGFDADDGPGTREANWLAFAAIDAEALVCGGGWALPIPGSTFWLPDPSTEIPGNGPV